MLDRLYERVPGQRRWFPPSTSKSDVSLLDPLKGRVCNIIGRGRSIDNLTAEDFPDPEEPVVCINGAADIVVPLDLPNPLYWLFLDRIASKEREPRGMTLLIRNYCKDLYPEHKNTLIIEYLMGNAEKTSSPIKAVQLCMLYGVSAFKFWGFDYCTKGSSLTAHGANSLDKYGTRSSYGNTCARLHTMLKDFPHTYMSPS